MKLDLNKIQYKRLGFFRFKKLKGKYLLTNDYGHYVFLSRPEFQDFLADKLKKNKEPYLSLVQKNFVKSELDLSKAIEDYQNKKSFLFSGPGLHIIVVTLRCNQRCVYCHASAQAPSKKGLDMSRDTAARVVDKIFETTNPFVVIEFQGGEPLLNWPIIRFITAQALKKAKETNKETEIRLVSNFSLMTQEKFDYLISKKVSLCTSLDGPGFLHNKNRPKIGRGDNYREIVRWSRKFYKLYPKLLKKGYVFKMAALLTISRASLSYWKEIIDEYMKLGFNNIALRSLDPFGFFQNSWKHIAYSADDFLQFYKNALDYIIELNFKGKKFKECVAEVFLKKILENHDPNHLDYRSPCGAGIGQLAYNYNGRVYSCDEGRMMSMMGDESFCLGDVAKNSYAEIVGNPVVRTLCMASCLEILPGCSDCVYKPYCGVCPTYNYFAQGNIFGQMPNNERCKINQGILDFLFEKLQDSKTEAVFREWLKGKF